MGDWQSLLQSVVLGLILSFLLAKLISFLTGARSTSSQRHATDRADTAPGPGPNATRFGPKPDIGEAHEAEPVVAELGSVRNDGMASGSSGSNDDEDWEGVESTELDEAFSAATAFVAAAAADQLSQKVSTDLQLQLYGLYKIATEGPCNVPQPSALKMTARAKWQAWQKLGAMPPEDAMQKYIDLVTELYPSWADGGSALRSKGNDGGGTSSEAKGPMGPVFSSFVYEEADSGTESKMDAIHGFAREGDVANLLKCLENGVSVNLKDSEGRTPLHWAVDRGHFSVTELLIKRNADVNAKDNDGQTPLHYAVICEREAIAECLMKHNADADLKDNDGSSTRDLCESNWPWMQQQHVGDAN